MLIEITIYKSALYPCPFPFVQLIRSALHGCAIEERLRLRFRFHYENPIVLLA